MPAALPKQPMTGQFPGSVKPLRDRPGLYLRISKKTGERVWSYFADGQWFKYSNSKDGAIRKYRDGKVSKYQSLPWFGMQRFQSA